MGRQYGRVPYGVRDRYKVHHQLMYEPMETEIDRMKRIPIEDFLARLGHSPVQRRTNALWYKAPYREERTASFKVNMERNLWYDYGLGKGGNIFALAGEFIHCADFLSQVRYVAEVAGMPLPEKKVYHPCEVRRPVEPSFEDVELMPLPEPDAALLHAGKGHIVGGGHRRMQGDTLHHTREAVFCRGIR